MNNNVLVHAKWLSAQHVLGRRMSRNGAIRDLIAQGLVAYRKTYLQGAK